MNLAQFCTRVHRSLRARRRLQLRDVRAEAARIVEFGTANGYLKRSVLGSATSIVNKYYPLPELIENYRHQQEVHREHIRNGDFDDSHEPQVLLEGILGLCSWWLKPHLRYPYGDVRLLRPLIGEVLIASTEWPRSPYPDMSARLGRWYEELAPGGPLYPSDEHLDYVRRFEAFAERIVWSNCGRDYLTIINFPAPANALPPTRWWCTQHDVIE